jgi:hypothetical protein
LTRHPGMTRNERRKRRPMNGVISVPAFVAETVAQSLIVDPDRGRIIALSH